MRIRYIALAEKKLRIGRNCNQKCYCNNLEWIILNNMEHCEWWDKREEDGLNV